jgi:hypothetical protein
MEIVVLVIAMAVAVDAFIRFHGRGKVLPRREQTMISTQKIVVDLSKRL